MNDTANARGVLFRPAVYRSRVYGRLDLAWSERPGGMTIVIRDEQGYPVITELTSQLPDQAALTGVLNQLCLSLTPWLSVECMSAAPCRDDAGQGAQ